MARRNNNPEGTDFEFDRFRETTDFQSLFANYNSHIDKLMYIKYGDKILEIDDSIENLLECLRGQDAQAQMMTLDYLRFIKYLFHNDILAWCSNYLVNGEKLEIRYRSLTYLVRTCQRIPSEGALKIISQYVDTLRVSNLSKDDEIILRIADRMVGFLRAGR